MGCPTNYLTILYVLMLATGTATGLNETLSKLDAVFTLFAPTNAAFGDYGTMHNMTFNQAMAEPPRDDDMFTIDALMYHIIREALTETSDFSDDQVSLPTLLPANNLTVMLDDTNSTETMFVVSYGSEAGVITPPMYACNLVIYGIDSVLIPEESLLVDEYDYGARLNDSLEFYRSQWVGPLEGQDVPSWRGDAFTHEIGPSSLDWGDITGGVMEGGETGTVKITPTIAWTTSMLAWGMLSFGDGYNKSDADLWAKSKETLKWNADYLLKTIKDDPFSSAKNQKPEFYIVYQVGNQTIEKGLWTRPEDETTPRPAYYMTTYNGTSDLASQLSAALSATAMVFQNSDLAYYQQLMNISTLLYEAGRSRRALYTSRLNYPCAINNPRSSVGQTSGPTCLPGDELFRGAMIATYNSTSYNDDLAWAAAWLHLATNNSTYLNDAYRWYNAHYVSTEADYDNQFISDWNQLIYPAALLLANITDDYTFHYVVQAYLRNWLCTSGDAVGYSDLGRAFSRTDPSLAQGMNSAFLALIYAQMITPSEANLEADRYTHQEYAKRYSCWAQSQARYVLGDVTRSFVVGAGTDAPTHISDRASSCPEDPQTPCSFLNAYTPQNPNPNLPVGGLVYGPGLGGDSFQDQRSGSNQTWVSHAHNAGLTGVFAGLNQMVSGDGGYDQCLQDYGLSGKTLPLNVCTARTP